jgi:hypothetical protein
LAALGTAQQVALRCRIILAASRGETEVATAAKLDVNLIERWFAELTNKRIRRDSFFSVADLTAAIEEFLAAWSRFRSGCRLPTSANRRCQRIQRLLTG